VLSYSSSPRHLAYELGYWFNHWLSHKVRLLGEFHKVHHNAEVLTPLTNFRVHPVCTWVFTNILAVSAAVANGFGNYMFGETAYQLSDTNIILVLFIHAYVQHSHMWIAFRGVLGRIFVSPAHHQVHHSANPKHFNKNFGSCLAAVGLDVRHALCTGEDARAPHLRLPRAAGCAGELVDPFINAAGHIWPKRPADMPALPVAERKPA